MAERPRVSGIFGVPPGADFPAALKNGLLIRMNGEPPEALARVEILVNTRRMQRRLAEMFAAEHALLLPRIRLITDLALDPALNAPPISSLRRTLELAQLVRELVAREPDLASRHASFDLAESLGALCEEMEGEGVSHEALTLLNVDMSAGHWARSLKFLNIATGIMETHRGAEAQQRAAVASRIAEWNDRTPDHPIIVAGSTGSRGTTALLMEAVVGLSQGAVVLPGFDFDLPRSVWDRMSDPLVSEDHPQFRFARFANLAGIAPWKVRHWDDAAEPTDRNRLISLSLRPAPVTDQWTVEGRDLPDLRQATADMALVEASSPREEALAIALRLRRAVEDRQSAALVTPDRNLTRQVTAMLDRWRILPDDSAGRPLDLSPPGRFLRHVAGLMADAPLPDLVLALLKHPLCHSGKDRGTHLIHTRDLELWVRRKGVTILDVRTLDQFEEDGKADGLAAWLGWLGGALLTFKGTGDLPGLTTGPQTPDRPAPKELYQDSLQEFAARHRSLAENLAAGSSIDGSGALWDEAAGLAALAACDSLAREADAGGAMTARDFAALLDALLRGSEVRDPVQPRPDIMIWGTLEARVQGADLVILGGLNEGSWPETPAPDSWLNRTLRLEAGLLLPERRIGLAAHDYQQAVAAPEVVLTRAVRDAEAATVMSRWVNRLVNLMEGLPDRHGPEALTGMRRKGRYWLDLARALDTRVVDATPAKRPAPRPPTSVRPTSLSVTEIQTLIRDPYAVYAKRILKVRPLDPLRRGPDARLRGTVLHAVMEAFFREHGGLDAPDPRKALLDATDKVLNRDVPWAMSRVLWRSDITAFAGVFLMEEAQRRANAVPIALECRGAFTVPGTEVTLKGTVDRIDRREDGRLAIYDYKTGTLPSSAQMQHFDRQLMIEAAMAEAGAWDGVDPAEVALVGHIGVKRKAESKTHLLREDETLDPDRTLAELRSLIVRFAERDQGYQAMRAMHKSSYTSDYEHLARRGEWGLSDAPRSVDVG